MTLTPEMIEAMLSAPDLERAMGETAADMVESGWTYQEAMVAIAAAFGLRLRVARLKHGAMMKALEDFAWIHKPVAKWIDHHAASLLDDLESALGPPRGP